MEVAARTPGVGYNRLTTVNKLALLLLLMLPACALAQGDKKVPEDYTYFDDNLSPDGRYVVVVPKLDDERRSVVDDNRLVDLQTGRTLAVLKAGHVAASRSRYGDIPSVRWSSDNSIMAWYVEGKWSNNALVVLKHDGKRVFWQSNVLKIAQEAILARTKEAAPEKYARVRKENAAMAGGTDDPKSSYPHGFSIQVDVTDPLEFPLHIKAELTSEAKPGTDLYNWLTSQLTGTIDAEGKLAVTSFGLGLSKPSHFGGDY